VVDARAVAAVVARALCAGERAWLVGGTVRDSLLHVMSADVDLAVAGDCDRLARALADELGGTPFAFSERFVAWRVTLEEGCVDLAPLRAATIEEDLAGRDFTVNAMARPVEGGDLVDPLGGLSDLRASRLRLCAPGALDDDPVRVLRLARLACAFDLEPDEGAEGAARAAAGGLAAAPGERVQHELSALLALPAAARAVRRLEDLGALAAILPELARCRGVSQNPYHHLDVLDHTLEALEFLPQVVIMLGGERFLTPPDDCGLPGVAPLVPLAWAALVHDIGKPDVRDVAADGRITFWHHDELGAGMVAAVGERLRLSRRFCEYLARLVRRHLRLGFLVRETPLSKRALVRYRNTVEPFVFEAIALSLADRLATRGERTPPEALARHFRIARDVFGDTPPAPRRRLLSGDEVMEVLGLESGPAVGAALVALQEEIDVGEVTTADEARAFVLAWWSRRLAGRPEEDGA